MKCRKSTRWCKWSIYYNDPQRFNYIHMILYAFLLLRYHITRILPSPPRRSLSRSILIAARQECIFIARDIGWRSQTASSVEMSPGIFLTTLINELHRRCNGCEKNPREHHAPCTLPSLGVIFFAIPSLVLKMSIDIDIIKLIINLIMWLYCFNFGTAF